MAGEDEITRDDKQAEARHLAEAMVEETDPGDTAAAKAATSVPSIAARLSTGWRRSRVATSRPTKRWS